MMAEMKQFSSKSLPIIQSNLLTWFKQEQRDLPWRKEYDPYHVWVSEIMLQQTQVKTALPYHKRWLEALPTIRDVAEAEEDTILKLWEGLGYYSRARNLQKAAKAIVEEHGGIFPQNYDDIRKLPGVGPYTAGAITSIAFNQEQPIVDGNIIRLIARLLNYSENTRLPKNVKKFWERAEKMIPQGEARNFNQGMMEFGALMCTPKNPKCGECPLQSECKGYEAGGAAQLPNRGPKQEKVPIKVAIVVISAPNLANKIFIQKRQHGGLMGGLWEFPGGKCEANETPKKALNREIKEELGITLKNIKPLKRIKHAYTKYSVDLHCFKADHDQGELSLNSATDHRWVDVTELEQFPFPAANVRLIKELLK
jgi:A/G-specific adenine glycosylase